jgi:GNAT superfamily N-acetyltransferase
MKIEMILQGKKRFLNLLLLADEQENMIDRYLERGEMFVLYDDDVKGICVVTDEGNGTCEIKNIAINEKHQKKGYGKKLIEYVVKYYRDRYETMYVGTGDRSRALGFYEHCGFEKSHCVPHFFIDHYYHPIYEEGEQLVDMVYLKIDLKSS